MNFPFFRRRKWKIILTAIIDTIVFKKKNKIVFVSKKKFPFSGNLRLVCEEMSRNKDLELFVFDEGYIPENTINYLSEKNIKVLSSFSLTSVFHITTASKIIISHSIRDAYISRKNRKRKIINLWHGVPIKKIEMAMPHTSSSRYNLIRRNSDLYDLMIASSPIDRLAISACFNIDYKKVKTTGLPRFDMLKKDYAIPGDQHILYKNLSKLLKNKKFILYAPTFRENNVSIMDSFSSNDIENLKIFLEKNGCILGIRTHSYDSNLCDCIDGNLILDCSARVYIETNLLLRYVDILIVDYSSIWVDYLLLNRPIVGYIPDYKTYKTDERDFLYDYEKVFPGNMTRTSKELIAELEKLLYQDNHTIDYNNTKDIFLENTFNCTQNVVKIIGGNNE
ncbi:MAG: CDP-glycerol glycerophosphotransferase family protein [Sulfurovum sp.]|nr:CDP-glycerol glycerophosphotransferase family protein [Sulfurovum sp.]